MDFLKIKKDIKGMVALLTGIYVLVSLISFSEKDPSIFTFSYKKIENYGGPVGSYISDILFTLFGFSSVFIPVFMILFGLRRLLNMEGHRIRIPGSILLIISSSIFLSLLELTIDPDIQRSRLGGMMGYIISTTMYDLFSIFGSYLFTFLLIITSAIMLSPVSISSLGIRRGKEAGGASYEEDIKEEIMEEDNEGILRIVTSSRKEQVKLDVSKKRVGEYEFPPLSMLKIHNTESILPSKEEILTLSQNIERKLKDFDVDGKVTHVHPGPVVTMYEFEPAPGVKINKVVSLSDDLSLSLKAQSIRIYPVPGKSSIGIEVPNSRREVVSLYDIIATEIFQKSPSRLTLGLGKDIIGNPVVIDLSKMPHLLVAGATGSGKSVSLNSMIISILYKSTPSEVKLLMIDPKFLELSPYEGIGHLISPVVTNPKDARDALRKMVFEMERRYRLLAEKGAKNIESYNRICSEEERLPYIVIIIDELADLMLTGASEVEDSIGRLAQMARASGIHLICATQRPSVDVITGVIKANFPARIAFQVTSRIDSRTILDTQGAEQLLGMGDMLLMIPGMRLKRVHGAYVTEEEIKTITDFIKARTTPDYSIIESIEIKNDESSDENEEIEDELYNKVIELGESLGEISISLIQRRFKIGFNRAARLMEMLENDGYVGPQKAAGKPREFIGRRR